MYTLGKEWMWGHMCVRVLRASSLVCIKMTCYVGRCLAPLGTDDANTNKAPHFNQSIRDAYIYNVTMDSEYVCV